MHHGSDVHVAPVMRCWDESRSRNIPPTCCFEWGLDEGEITRHELKKFA